MNDGLQFRSATLDVKFDFAKSQITGTAVSELTFPIDFHEFTFQQVSPLPIAKP